MESALQEFCKNSLPTPAKKCWKSHFFFIIIFLLGSNIYGANQQKLDSLEAEGLRLYKKAEFKAAIDIYKLYLKLADSTVSIEKKLNAMNNLANCHTNMGNFMEGINIYLESIKTVEKLGKSARLGRSYNNLGSFYSETGDFENALKYFSKGEELGAEFGDSMLLADVYNNKGLIFEQQGDFNKAKADYEKALKIYLSIGDKERISLAYNNMGIALKYLKLYDEALEAYEKSIEAAKAIDNKYLASANLVNIGNLQLMRNLPKSAIEYYLKGIAMAEESGVQAVVVEAYDGLASAYANLNNYGKAYEYSRKFEALKSSQINEDYKQTIAELQTKFDTERQEQRIGELEAQKRIATLELEQKGLQLQRRNLLLMAAIVLVLLLVVSGYFLYQRNRQKMLFEQQLAIHQTELNERSRIAKDLHDELGAGLAKVSLIADISQNKASVAPEMQDNLKSIASTSKELISSMRDLVWTLNAQDLSLDTFVSRLRQYTNEYLDNFSIEYTIDFPVNFPEIVVSKTVARQFMLTYKEALTNAVKHSHATLLVFSLRLQGDTLHFNLKDNGIGINRERMRVGSNGLKNMEQRMVAIGGDFKLQSAENEGTSIDILFSLSALQGKSV